VKPCTGEDFLARYARAAYDVGKDEVAEAALKEGEEKYPESPVFHLIKGRELLDAKFTRAAVDAFEKALQIDPSSVEANVSLAQGLRAEGKLGEAVTRLKAAIEKNESVPLLLELARTNQDQHDWGAAETALRRAVTLEPANTRIQQDLGTMIAEQGRAEEASRILAALDAKGALDRAGLVILAAAYLQMHELGRGRDLLARLYAKFPEDADIASEYGRALTEAGSFQRADEVLKKAASDTPGHAPTHYQLGKLRIRQNELPGAIEEFSRAVQLAQTNQKYRLELARALLVAGGGDRARDARLSLDAVVAAYQRGDVQQDERDPEAYILRGRMLFEEQKYPQAMKDFEAALVLAPSRLDTLVGFGRSLFEMARYSDAEPYFRQILTRDAMHAEANYYLGRILLRAGRIDEAKVHLEKSVARDGKLFPEAHRQLGFIYKDQGMIPLARRAFTSYLDLAQKGTAEVEEVRRMLDRLKK
jgi:tetratricopeptide (TPR) repeat protein